MISDALLLPFSCFSVAFMSSVSGAPERDRCRPGHIRAIDRDRSCCTVASASISSVAFDLPIVRCGNWLWCKARLIRAPGHRQQLARSYQRSPVAPQPGLIMPSFADVLAMPSNFLMKRSPSVRGCWLRPGLRGSRPFPPLHHLAPRCRPQRDQSERKRGRALKSSISLPSLKLPLLGINPAEARTNFCDPLQGGAHWKIATRGSFSELSITTGSSGFDCLYGGGRLLAALIELFVVICWELSCLKHQSDRRKA